MNSKHLIQWAGFVLGPVLALLCVFVLPDAFEIIEDGKTVTREFTWAGRATLGAMVWMGVWWLTEALEISVTALLPIPLFPLAGIASASDACGPYAHPLIFLYLGGFVIALSMERWGLGKRLALLTLRLAGTSQHRMIAGFMAVTAVLSAFVSNTATTAMMLPIALSVIALVESKDERSDVRDNFASCLLLAIAYSASVGGIMTVIGTPTNGFLMTFLKESIADPYKQEVTFLSWLPIGASLVIVTVPVIYLVMVRWFGVKGGELKGGKQLVQGELEALGKINRGECNTLAVFAVTVCLWLLRPYLTKFEVTLGDEIFVPLAAVNDSVIAMLAAIALCLIPVDIKERRFTADWSVAAKIPWGILFLFGGGLSLAKAVADNDVAEFIGSQSLVLNSVPEWIVVVSVAAAIVFLTELTSNAATTASLVPVLAAMAPGLGIHPYMLVIPATIAASCAFMLPVATPPNAIVFGSGKLQISQMVRIGLILNFITIVIVTVFAFVIVRPYLGC